MPLLMVGSCSYKNMVLGALYLWIELSSAEVIEDVTADPFPDAELHAAGEKTGVADGDANN